MEACLGLFSIFGLLYVSNCFTIIPIQIVFSVVIFNILFIFLVHTFIGVILYGLTLYVIYAYYDLQHLVKDIQLACSIRQNHQNHIMMPFLPTVVEHMVMNYALEKYEDCLIVEFPFLFVYCNSMHISKWKNDYSWYYSCNHKYDRRHHLHHRITVTLIYKPKNKCQVDYFFNNDCPTNIKTFIFRNEARLYLIEAMESLQYEKIQRAQMALQYAFQHCSLYP